MYPTTLGTHSTVGVEGKDLTGLIGLGGGQILYALLSSSENFPFQKNRYFQYLNHLPSFISFDCLVISCSFSYTILNSFIF